ncbi:STAS/SEC14 domain-containing protein [Sphingomonas sp. Leaf343]|uniref:STAS/SEC14 domain-containing protein n=1 Tax=Sphingomonas sp. Leaf343 TaxID=1736345 RepID=UPI0006F8EB65|nr:STAS/SEC14 domain-containing protein [Sphingomonas sp. Leaf343]KQR80795.1 hypothetical protein ASG07_13435 [Sphingomonas sp. Leaf343]
MTANAHFSITIDPALHLMSIRMGGFFSEADVAGFDALLRDKVKTLTCGPNEHVTLVDVSDMKIQLQDIVQMFAKIVSTPRHRSRRLAFVTGSSLARMQTRRLTDRPDVEFFTDPDAAKAWLFD